MRAPLEMTSKRNLCDRPDILSDYFDNAINVSLKQLDLGPIALLEA
jgi:hypothetical protein